MNLKILKYIPLIILLLSVHTIVHATEQIPDKILIENESFNLLGNPLETYFSLYPEKRPKRGIISTALWRGYIATFEILNSKLMIENIEVEFQDEKRKIILDGKSVYPFTKRVSALKEIFKDKDSLIADWYSHLLVIPKGNKLDDEWDRGYNTYAYEYYNVLQINSGTVVQERLFSYKSYIEFKNRQFEEFKKTYEYEKVFNEFLKDWKDPKTVNEFILEHIIDFTSSFLVNLDNS